MILAGDIGGTKTTLALCDDKGAIQREATEASTEFESLEDVIAKFAPGEVTAACFGVAGPVVDGAAKITNLPWTIAQSSLEKKLHAKVQLLNDLQATALGLLVLPETAFATLQAGPRPEHATIAVIAPGTGLGEALLVHDGRRYHALPSEGGHADFAPTTDEEIELLRFLRGKYGDHISNERVLSGNGIGDLYDFCRMEAGSEGPDLEAGDRNAAISKAGLAKTDPCAQRALDLFAQVLAGEASNHALRGLALGGIVIGGGIPPKLLPVLETRAFSDRLTAKGRFHSWTRALSVRVALEPRAALLGAAHQASLLP
ncbi:glucokinase [soil metagenome]